MQRSNVQYDACRNTISGQAPLLTSGAFSGSPYHFHYHYNCHNHYHATHY